MSDQMILQLEIVVSFFTGYYEEGVYHDDLHMIGMCFAIQ